MRRPVQRLLGARPDELPALLWAFAYFFCLLCSYYILRPLREEMGIAGGLQNLPWVFTGTWFVMLACLPLFGAAAARLPRRRLLPWVYYFFIGNILVFYLLFKSTADPAPVARAFFIWTSVFNLFVVSVFWSFMVDLFSNAQARRLFGVIAAGGSLGAVAGPALTALLAVSLGPIELLLVSALLLAAAVLCIQRLLHWTAHAPRRRVQSTPGPAEAALGGGVFAGIAQILRSRYLTGIAGFLWLYTTLSTFVYFEQAYVVAANFSGAAARTALFAKIDLAVNLLTLLSQMLLTGRIVQRLGLPATLTLVPVLTAAGFAALALAPAVAVLVTFQILRRAGDYALTRPAREVLFTVVDRAAKYKAKNVLDTVVYRTGDALAAWTFTGLKALGISAGSVAWLAVPLALLWAGLGFLLGTHQEALRRRREPSKMQ